MLTRRVASSTPRIRSLITGGNKGGGGGKQPPKPPILLPSSHYDDQPKQKPEPLLIQQPNFSSGSNNLWADIRDFEPTPSSSSTPTTTTTTTGNSQPIPDKEYYIMPGGFFTPPTPTYGPKSQNVLGDYDPNLKTIKLDASLSSFGRAIVYEHEKAHAAHATYISLATGNLSPQEAEDVAENLLLTEITAFSRQAIKTLELCNSGKQPENHTDRQLVALAEMYKTDILKFYRLILDKYTLEYQGKFTGLNGTNGKQIKLRDVAEHLFEDLKQGIKSQRGNK